MSQPMRLPPTEQRNPLSAELDSLPTLDLVRLMNRLDATIPLVIAEQLEAIAQVADWAADRLAAGARVFYQGAGTSGRLAVLDAVELLPTFRLAPGRVIPLLAGGEQALTRSIEGAEDDEQLGRADLLAHQFDAGDLLIGVAASGRTPYALGGLRYAAEVGAATAALVCNPQSPMAAAAQVAIELVTGPEVLTGSTRLRAGTAQKLALNMISTAAMVRLGKVYGNLMVDVKTNSHKLRDRARRILEAVTGLDKDTAAALLEQTHDLKTALVMQLAGVEEADAQARLAAAGGQVRAAVEAGS